VSAIDMFDPQIRQMGTLLSRIEGGGKKEDQKLSRVQVASMIEVFIPRFVQGAPGMPDGMVCDIQKTSDDSWTIHIKRPPS
jgi:hypothetical protein